MKEPVDLHVGGPDILLVRLAGPQVGGRGLEDDVAGHAEVQRQPPDLSLVQVPERIDPAGQVTEDRSVPQEQFGLVARAHDQRPLAGRKIVEHRHPLARHLVAAPERRCPSLSLEVGVDHRRDRKPHAPRPEEADHEASVAQAVRTRRAVGEEGADDVPGPQRPHGQSRRGGGVDTARKPQDGARESRLAGLPPDEIGQQRGGGRSLEVEVGRDIERPLLVSRPHCESLSPRRETCQRRPPAFA